MSQKQGIETLQGQLDEIDELIDSTLHPGEREYLMKKKEEFWNKIRTLEGES